MILSPIEQSIKQKIEAVGTPLRDWDIRINRGILTGYNEAFIIDKKKRDELIKKDAKSAEIIRPILRGRDIRKYGYDFADLYLIYIPWHFPLHNDTSVQGASLEAEKLFEQDYPAIYSHLLKFKEKLSSRNKSETGIRYEWYALQRWGAKYWDDFSKPKIIYPNMTKYLPFYLDRENFVANQKCFIMTGEKLEFLVSFFNSNVFKVCFKDYFPELQGGTRELSKIFFENIPIPKFVKDIAVTEEEIYKIYDFNESEINWISSSLNE
ncbi:TaqI-like C-terminal specificity domain-containing protein [Streptococcus caviae]|uniref:TaqI-like C-terminal specificity domain-containing protein n=1 Tax=Streptococcus sp. 'caviae' TaxID=1915004 RepID=UPI00214CA0E4|nr:TaqI-like C-terminal specificity domain-containing protein [Streptococcus sp. 'caviae']